jgi:hypothetical protein
MLLYSSSTNGCGAEPGSSGTHTSNPVTQSTCGSGGSSLYVLGLPGSSGKSPSPGFGNPSTKKWSPSLVVPHHRAALSCILTESAQLSPAGPAGPCAPSAPAGPCAPSAPGGPSSPCSPCSPWGSAGPRAPLG